MPRKSSTNSPKAGAMPGGRKRGRRSRAVDIVEVDAGAPDLADVESDAGAQHPLRCALCEHPTSGLGDCAGHIAEVHAAQLELCDLCSRAFIDHDEYEAHVAQHLNKSVSTVSCAHCILNFTNSALLEQHDFDKHEAVSPGLVLRRYIPHLTAALHTNFIRFINSGKLSCKIMCHMCSYNSEDRADYVEHLKKCKMNKKYVCEKCGNIYKKKSSLEKHYATNPRCQNPDYTPSLLPPDRMKSKCKICDKRMTPPEMRTHVKTCRRYECRKCSVQFESLDEYNEHNLTTHNESLKVSNCPYCRMEFIKPALLEKHVAQHEKYSCLECGKKFRMPKPLLKHIRFKHKNVEPYKCVPCAVTFKEGFDFKSHITEHADKGYINFDENLYVTFSFEPPKKSEQYDKEHNETASSMDVSVEEDSVRAEETEQNEAKDSTEKMDNTQKELASESGDKEPESESEVKLASESEDIIKAQSEDEAVFKTPKVQRRSKRQIRTKRQFDDSSDDEPLIVKKRTKKRVLVKSRPRKSLSTKKTYFCTICSQRANNLDAYNRHVTRHFKAGAKQCVQCAKILPNRQQLDQHIKETHMSTRPMNRLHKFLKARAMSKMEAVKAARRAQAPVQPVKKLPPVPPVRPFRMRLIRVAPPTYDIIENGEIRMSSAQVKIVEHDGPVPKNKIGDMTVQNYVENFLPDETVQEKPQKIGKIPPVQQLTTNKHLKIRSVRSVTAMNMFKVRVKKFKEEKPSETKCVGIAKPKPFRNVPKEPTNVIVTMVDKYEERPPRLDFGTCIEADTDQHQDIYDTDYFETDDHNVAELEVSSTPAPPKIRGRTNKSTKGYVVEVSSGEPTTEEIESKLAEVCMKLELPVARADLHIGQLTTSAPFYQIVNVKQVLKRQQKETKEQQLKKRFEEIRIGNARMVPANPLAHLMRGVTLPGSTKKPPVKSISVTPLQLTNCD